MLAIGREKSGKSTFLTFCAFTQAILRETTVKMPSPAHDDDIDVTVIEQEAAFKRDYSVFQIGHESGKTCTKKPEFEYCKTQDITYGDLVGLLDAQGEAGDYITQLLWQQIFRTAKNVRFVVLLIVDDFEDYERDEYDSELRNAIDYLSKIAHLTNKNLEAVFDSVLPLMSLVKPTDDFNLEEYQQKLKDLLYAHFEISQG